MSHGSFYQHHLCSAFRSVAFAYLCRRNRHYPHDIYGYPSACSDGCNIRCIFVGHFLQALKRKNHMCRSWRDSRHGHYRCNRVLSRYDVYMGKNRSYMVLLCTVIYMRNSHRRKYRLCIPQEIGKYRFAQKIPEYAQCKSL